MDRREFEQAQRRAKAEHDRRNHTRLASTLASYLQEGGTYSLRQEHPSDGSGVAPDRIRFIIDVEAPLF